MAFSIVSRAKKTFALQL